MFIMTAKVTRRKTLTIAAVCVLVILVIVLVKVITSNAGATAVSVSGIKTNEDRIAYLTELGWDVEPEPVEVQEVLIPEEFSEVYQSYNEIQKGCGFDLTYFSGKLITRYSYLLKSYPGTDESVYAELLIYKDCVIGGDIHSLSLGGFMHGLIAN